MNDVDFPVQRVLDGIDAAAAAGLPVKVNAVVKRGVNDGDRRRARRAFPRHAATSSASSSTWTSARRTAGGSRTSSAADEIVGASASAGRSSPSPPRPAGRDRPPLPLRRRRRRDRRDRVRHEAVLRRAARARASRPRAASTRACSPRAATISAPRSRLGASDEELAETLRGDLVAPHRPLLRAAHRGHRGAGQGRDVVHRRLGGTGLPEPRTIRVSAWSGSSRSDAGCCRAAGLHFGLQVGIWFGFYISYLAVRSLVDRDPAKAVTNGLRRHLTSSSGSPTTSSS